jgi:hypothetical protein
LPPYQKSSKVLIWMPLGEISFEGAVIFLCTCLWEEMP